MNKTELINGKYYSIKEAAELIGLSYRGYTKRKERAGTAQEAYDLGVKGYRNRDKTELINGKYYTVAEAADLIGIPYQTYVVRKFRNHTAQEAFDMGESGRLKKK